MNGRGSGPVVVRGRQILPSLDLEISTSMSAIIRVDRVPGHNSDRTNSGVDAWTCWDLEIASISRRDVLFWLKGLRHHYVVGKGFRSGWSALTYDIATGWEQSSQVKVWYILFSHSCGVLIFLLQGSAAKKIFEIRWTILIYPTVESQRL